MAISRLSVPLSLLLLAGDGTVEQGLHFRLNFFTEFRCGLSASVNSVYTLPECINPLVV